MGSAMVSFKIIGTLPDGIVMIQKFQNSSAGTVSLYPKGTTLGLGNMPTYNGIAFNIPVVKGYSISGSLPLLNISTPDGTVYIYNNDTKGFSVVSQGTPTTPVDQFNNTANKLNTAISSGDTSTLIPGIASLAKSIYAASGGSQPFKESFFNNPNNAAFIADALKTFPSPGTTITSDSLKKIDQIYWAAYYDSNYKLDPTDPDYCNSLQDAIDALQSHKLSADSTKVDNIINSTQNDVSLQNNAIDYLSDKYHTLFANNKCSVTKQRQQSADLANALNDAAGGGTTNAATNVGKIIGYGLIVVVGFVAIKAIFFRKSN